MNTNNNKTSLKLPQPISTKSAFSTSINLLPPEVILKRKQSFKISLINKLSALALITLIFFTSTTIALRLSQSFTLREQEQGLVRAEEKVSALKGKEGQALILKQRLDSIQQLSLGDAKRKAIFNLVVFLTPPEIQITEASIDKNSAMNLSLVSPSLSSLEVLVANLENPEKNSNMINKVSMEGLSVGKDLSYRFSLKIIPK